MWICLIKMNRNSYNIFLTILLLGKMKHITITFIHSFRIIFVLLIKLRVYLHNQSPNFYSIFPNLFTIISICITTDVYCVRQSIIDCFHDLLF